MGGYFNYSMSNNAMDAYVNGEKPKSKWKKSDIIEAILNEVEEIAFDMKLFKKLKIEDIKRLALKKTSWHHTSSHYNKTDFYSIDTYAIENLTNEKIELLLISEKPCVIEEDKGIKSECAFLEWSGTRKHPKATEVVEVGIIKGDWFYRPDGSKKNIYAKGFRIISHLQ